jgi:hypothetical protein
VGDRASTNQALFRRANDELRGRYVELLATGAVPFICECGNERCTRVMSLTLEEYETVRAGTDRFAIVPGHELADLERVVHANDRYAVVEKRRAGAPG